MSATLKRDLRTGRSVWATGRGLNVPVRPLKEAVSVDVAIVGSGISGAMAAFELSKDHSVVVLDRRPPLTGSTVASTALLQWEIDQPLTDLADRIGPTDAARAWKRSYQAVADLGALVRAERIPCAWDDRDTLYLAGDQFGFRALKDEAAARADLGLPSRFLSAAEVRDDYGIDRTGAVLSQDSASADPARLAAGLLRRAVANGARVHSPVEVLDILPDPDGVTLATDTGLAVRAQQVVLCCGYEFPKAVPTEGAGIASTWAIASQPGAACPAWLKRTLVWEASDPYLYLRCGPDGRVIAGGEDEESPTAHEDPARLKRKCEAVARKVSALIPGLELEVDYAWSGAFGTSTTGLPIIGPVPGMDRVQAVMGFGGNGITFSMIASQIVSAAIRGKPDPDADLFAPA